MTVPELIDQQMHHFIGKLITQNQLSHEKVMDIATHIGAYLIRNRHVQNSQISNDEINLVLQSIADFLNSNFEQQFDAGALIFIKNKMVQLLQNPSFDEEIQDYFQPFYSSK